ncbi:hypothetical protein F0L68_13220 [Solihabitans fulvus]|uniref:Uncharacterized protein n=1 Tax=Solihabitans fulvus TaxID=1892852 RepID=A0A5B2XFX8_9PSEU|nr:hypothetical protein [Solihabitans fulvus]KAA2262243.1 hypothetical protein F0L68_13220 [Solihabitans fulvus]
MQTWRVVATALFGAAGLILVLVAMAQARDRRGATHGHVVRVGLIALLVVVLVGALILTVLPSTVAWALVAACGIAVVTLTLAN